MMTLPAVITPADLLLQLGLFAASLLANLLSALPLRWIMLTKPFRPQLVRSATFSGRKTIDLMFNSSIRPKHSRCAPLLCNSMALRLKHKMD